MLLTILISLKWQITPNANKKLMMFISVSSVINISELNVQENNFQPYD